MMDEEKSEKVLIRIGDEVNLLTEIFTNLGVPEEDARIEAKILSDADLLG